MKGNRGSEDALPLVLLQHFRRNLDNWDPALIDALAATRQVITFDNVDGRRQAGSPAGAYAAVLGMVVLAGWTSSLATESRKGPMVMVAHPTVA